MCIMTWLYTWHRKCPDSHILPVSCLTAVSSWMTTPFPKPHPTTNKCYVEREIINATNAQSDITLSIEVLVKFWVKCGGIFLPAGPQPESHYRRHSLTGLLPEENQLEFTQRVPEFAASRHLDASIFRSFSKTVTNSDNRSQENSFTGGFLTKIFFATSRASFWASVRMRKFYFLNLNNNETSFLIG